MIRLQVIEGLNAADQLRSLHSIRSVWKWLHICDACVIATWTLGLRTPLVFRNSQLPAPSLEYNIVKFKTESTRKLSTGNFNFQWTKTLYQNNLKNIAFFFTFFKGLRCN